MGFRTGREGTPKYKQSHGGGDLEERRDPRRNENLCLKVVQAEPNDRAAEVFAVQNGIAASPKPRIVWTTFVVPDVFEVDDPQATALVADDVPACQVTVDEP